ncbi:hypothetical protein [Hymenobacter qilianensis]|uniref:Uncharacterized protein n=1 Tax=Hymenobacter qilianensis TaxID=1385715 RepID=A0A7H0GZA0_9BACT|nr:hypothetical protein [Hymenobacter qilianensis]QNP53616.1 hypothetical protein H9L05_08715 [Hymenobacter qilianensis]
MRLFLLTYLLFCSALCAQAQDTILRTNGEEIKAKVLAITPTEISYVPGTEPPSSDTLYMAATGVFLIRYANGTKVIISKTDASLVTGRTPAEMTNQGRMDAQKYFKAPGSLFVTATATAVSLIFLGPTTPGALGGIATGAAIGLSPIQSQNIIAPDTALLNDPHYLLGYQQQAQRKKIGKAAGGFGIGLLTGTVIWFAIALANTNHF